MCKSLNCSSCGGPVKLYSRDYGNCEYCGNTNRVLSTGETEIPKRETKLDYENPEPLPKKSKVSGRMLFLFILCGLLAGGLIVYYFSKSKKKGQISIA